LSSDTFALLAAAAAAGLAATTWLLLLAVVTCRLGAAVNLAALLVCIMTTTRGCRFHRNLKLPSHAAEFAMIKMQAVRQVESSHGRRFIASSCCYSQNCYAQHISLWSLAGGVVNSLAHLLKQAPARNRGRHQASKGPSGTFRESLGDLEPPWNGWDVTHLPLVLQGPAVLWLANIILV
jgi:hypothetical protein